MYPVRLHNNSKNYVKNPVRKKVYICLGIYGLLFIALIIPIFITQDDNLAMLLILPFCALSLVLLPLALMFVKKKEIEFFVKYLDFKPTAGFQPSNDIFGDYMRFVFSQDGLIIKGQFDEEFVIPYSILDFLAWPGYKGMGDMMTIFISINLKGKINYSGYSLEESETKEIESNYPVLKSDGFNPKENNAEFIDPKIEDLFSPVQLRLDQSLFDYFAYYKLSIKNLGAIIVNRAALMKDNCKFFR